MKIKEQLKGTCVLNEKEGMGAEIVALYTEAGFNNRYLMEGLDIDSYYGCDMNGDIDCTDEENTIFGKVLTLSQLREIVSTPEYKEPIKWSFAKETSPELEEQIKNAKPAKINSSEGIAQPISEPRFKAGDVVEVEGLEYMPEFVHSFDNVAWVKTSGQNFGQLVPLNKLRHPKDKLREKVEEMLNGSFRYQSIDKRRWIVEEDVKEMLTEAIKWGQENK